MNKSTITIPLKGIGFGEESTFFLKINDFDEYELAGGDVHKITLDSGVYRLSIREGVISSDTVTVSLDEEDNYIINLSIGSSYGLFFKSIFSPKSAIALKVTRA